MWIQWVGPSLHSWVWVSLLAKKQQPPTHQLDSILRNRLNYSYCCSQTENDLLIRLHPFLSPHQPFLSVTQTRSGNIIDPPGSVLRLQGKTDREHSLQPAFTDCFLPLSAVTATRYSGFIRSSCNVMDEELTFGGFSFVTFLWGQTQSWPSPKSQAMLSHWL